MNCVFVQVQCKPGQTYDVAKAIVDLERHSEIYSTSGEFDLLIKFYFDKEMDIGLEINGIFAGLDGVTRTMTTQTFKAF